MSRSVRAFAAGALALAASTFLPSVASAQQYLPSGSVQIGSGIEGGGRGYQRARTRLRIGVELRVDEQPEDAIFFAGLVDLEPKAAFGGEVRYVRSLGSRFSVGAGMIGYLAPGTLFGPCAGFDYRIPLMKKTYLTVGPEATVFPIGSDLPDGVVVWQALLQVGFRADLF